MLRRLWAIALLLLRFLRAVVVSGAQTVGVILRSGAGTGSAPPTALLRVRFGPLNARGAAVLGCLVSLTPGTTTLDIDMQRRELLLHVLDASDTRALLAGIRHDFEPSLQVLFPADGESS